MGMTWDDPTHGRIDRDIQELVDELNPPNIGSRVAMENTLQHRRDVRHQGHAGHKCDLPGPLRRLFRGLSEGSMLCCDTCRARRCLINGQWVLVE